MEQWSVGVLENLNGGFKNSLKFVIIIINSSHFSSLLTLDTSLTPHSIIAIFLYSTTPFLPYSITPIVVHIPCDLCERRFDCCDFCYPVEKVIILCAIEVPTFLFSHFE
jgi:hypothetical protein